jgi:HEAT repeat protein
MPMGMSLILLMLSGGALDNVLQAPPGDLASLLARKQVLEALQAPTDEDTLIALAAAGQVEAPGMAALRKAVADLGAEDFRARKAAKDTLSKAGVAARELLQAATQSDDPEVRLTAQGLLRAIAGKIQADAKSGDADYLKRLFAIRALGEMKSQKAVPGLKAAANDTDPTIRDAALSALAAVEGKPAPRPDAQKLLTSMAVRLPQNLSFVAMLDMTSGSKPITLAKVAEMLTAAAAKLPAQPNMPAAEVQQMLTQMLPQSRKGLQQIIGKTGNMRVDAVTVIMPTQWNLAGKGRENPDVYIAGIFQGLCSPERLAAALAKGMKKRALPGGQTVLYDRSDFAVCILDENTVVWASGPDRECRYMDKIVAQLQPTALRHPPFPLAATALALMKPEGTRLAVATLPDKLFAPAFLPEARGELTEEIERNRKRTDLATRPDKQLELAFFELALQALAANSLTGRLDVKGAVELKAQFADAEATKKLNAALDGMKASLDGFFTAQLVAADDSMKKAFTTDLKGKWWSTKLADAVTLTGSLHTATKALALALQTHLAGRRHPQPPMPMPMPMIKRLEAVPMR